MKVKQLWFVLSLLCSLPAMSQGYVAFNVVDSVGEGVTYATVRIHQLTDTVKAVVMDVTDADGRFAGSLPSTGRYTLGISSVGMAPYSSSFEIAATGDTLDLGTIMMSRDAALLNEVEVVAQRPLVKAEIDRLVYDIQADEDSKTKTIFDMLRKVPLVAVDGQENVLVKGSSNFKIYKNGRPNSSWSRNPRDVLKSIPANMIKRIEVITEPGAKYDAEGVNGILNIVTMDNTMVKGAAGSVGFYTSSRNTYDGNAYVTAQLGKFTTTVNYGINSMSRQSSRNTGVAEYVYGKSGNRQISSSENRSPGLVNYGNIEASYEIDSLNLITLSFGGYAWDSDTKTMGSTAMYGSDGALLYAYDTKSGYDRNRYFDFNGKLDYQLLTHRKGETMIFSYMLSTTNQSILSWDEYIDVMNMPIAYDRRDTDNSLRFYEHTFQLDYTRPFGTGHKMEVGAKYLLRLNDSETSYRYSLPDLNTLTEFRHTTHVGAAYAEYAYNSTRWGARAGLRYEYARFQAKYPSGGGQPFSTGIGDLVPTLSASYNINDRNSLKINYAMRISRPGIYYLNPAVNSTPTSVSYGNPDLKSVKRHSLNLAYTLMLEKISLNASVYGGYSDDRICSVTSVIPDASGNDIIHTTYGNVGKALDAGAFGYVQWRIGSKTSWMLNASANWLREEYRAAGLRNSGWNIYTYSHVSQELPWRLRATAGGGWNRNGVSGLYAKGDGSGWYSVSLTRKFLKEDRLTVTVSAVNPVGLARSHWSSRTVQGDYTGWNRNTYVMRQFAVGLSYRFGSFHASVKKAAKTISNDDLEGRK